MKSLKEKLLSTIDINPETGCWNWAAGKNTYGYGQVSFKGKVTYVHRSSFEIHCGPIPEGMFVCHRCDNRACINPEHLFVATNAENTADRHAKDRDAHLRGVDQNGAKLTEANVLAIRASTGATRRSLATKFGVSEKLIYCIRTRKNWTHLP